GGGGGADPQKKKIINTDDAKKSNPKKTTKTDSPPRNGTVGVCVYIKKKNKNSVLFEKYKKKTLSISEKKWHIYFC
ncbi:hypothetical protein ACQWKR_23535, partial [Salmonella enterica subsp. enterica serovar Infantis]